MYQKYIKRICDVCTAAVALLLLAFPMAIVAVITKIDSPGPVLFKQTRSGTCRKPFVILKFRSMPTSTPADLPTDQFCGADQLTRWQRLIRRTSLDELPQLLNVLMGHMSIIGPRPALENQTELLRARDACGANDVRPGLTGWAQINGRDTLSDVEKARLDGEYVRTLGNGRFRGLLMDLRCFFGTFSVVLRSNGFSEGGPHSSESND